MTAVPVESRRPIPRHARRRLLGVRNLVSVKIPKAVNSSIDWASRNRLMASCLVATVVIIVVAMAMSAYWLPAVTGLGGITVGAVLTRIADNALIEENRRLHEEIKGLALKAVPPVDTSASAETQQIWPIRGDR